MTGQEMMRFANDTLNILFSSDNEYRSFYMMLQQFAGKDTPSNRLLVPVKGRGVQVLERDGTLRAPTGEFTPNYLNLEYDPDVDTDFMWDILVDWVGSEEQAASLLNQLSVGLQPDWTGGKYLLFIGEGANGKSTLLKMLEKLVGSDNTSSVTRLEMAAKKVTVAALNGALMNIVFDGPKEFVKDSHVEKTAINGERFDLELKYKNIAVQVQTTALFLEGLNSEPKTSDHSPALQRRLVRYRFNKKYAENWEFEETMLSDRMLSALVKLIIKHWVTRGQKQSKLQATEESKQLQLEHQWVSSPLLQFLEYLAGTGDLLGMIRKDAQVDHLIAAYRPWLLENGYRAFDDGYIRQSVDESFFTTRKTVRIAGKPSSRRVITGLKETTRVLVEQLLEGVDDEVVRED